MVRNVVIWGGGAAIIVIVALTVGVGVRAASLAGASPTDRLTLLGDVGVAGTLLLAAVAAVAILAYAAATGPPDLHARVWNAFSDPGELLMKVQDQPETTADVRTRTIEPFKQVFVNIEIKNTSRWSARNPHVRVEVFGIFNFSGSPWHTAESITSLGVTAVDWDGGADYSIHRDDPRVLPALDLSGAAQLVSEPKPRLVVKMFAESYTAKPLEVPIRFVTADEWTAIMRQGRKEWEADQQAPQRA